MSALTEQEKKRFWFWLGSTEMVDDLAKRIIENIHGMSIDMWSDQPEGDKKLGLPTDADVRQRAAEYAEDILDDLRREVVERIKTMKFTSNFRAETVLQGELTFKEEE